MNLCRSLVVLLLTGFVSTAFAQTNIACFDTNECAVTNANVTYPEPPLKYPLTSDQYSVQYKLGNGAWTTAPVWISYYGGTLASPFNNTSPYVAGTSMSFVSIPAFANTNVQLLVTKLSSGFLPSDNVSVRPHTKPVHVNLATNGTVTLSTLTASNFAGDQFLLWWGDGTNGGNTESLVFFLDPPYPAPTGTNVMTITNDTQLMGLKNYDTLVFQGTVTIGGTGYQDYKVPTNINTIFLAPGAWVQGKLYFKYSGGVPKWVRGPGVLDGSLFCYALRACPDDEGDESLTFENSATNLPRDTYHLDGIVLTDHNHALNDPLVNGSVNNVKSIGWNAINGGFRLGDNTTVSNVFLRSCDDSLMMWGTNITVRNTTVWQNYNGGVVNLGWNDKSPGDGCLIDGLYVVKTDWQTPTDPGFNKTNLDGQNNAIIASLMVPGAAFGTNRPPLFRNIVVEDPPNVLFSLKIVFPECNDPSGPRFNNCTLADLTLPSVLNLNIENLCTPASLQPNSIGFLNIQSNFVYEFPASNYITVTNMFTLSGSMNIGLTNVIIQSSNGIVNPLTSANALAVGNFLIHGSNININYGFIPSQCLSCLPQLTLVSVGSNVVLTWPTNFPAFNLETATKLASPIVWTTNSTPPVIVNGLNVVTNPISGTRQFYRLSQ